MYIVYLSSLSIQGVMSLTGPVIDFIKMVQKIDNDNYPEVFRLNSLSISFLILMLKHM